ncbi:MAG: hypothetical protein OXE59_10440 [Bacteroidetes bacterium]|nr:hypothetical protein [Bacteroidota bacterium]MCY4234139.1 hypothetical protein [Bacteroidota bacterium]
MRIIIEPSVADDSNAHQWLDRILHRVSDGWHVWDINDHVDFSAFENTTWIQERGTKGLEILEDFIKSSERDVWDTWHHKKKIIVTSSPKNENEFIPEDAAKMVNEPLIIIVENQINDGKFIRRIFKELAPYISELLSIGAVRIDSIGGIGQMRHLIQDLLSNNSSGYRLIAIADSDKKSASDPESNSAQGLRKFCEAENISCWILAKRAAENYLPSILIKQFKPNDQRHLTKIEVWEKLSDEQKDFYDMKNGLPHNRDDTIYPLFQDISDADYCILEEGFHRTKLHRCWELLDNVGIDEELRNRSCGDLDNGISMIRNEI